MLIVNPFHERVCWLFQGSFRESILLFMFRVSLCFAVFSVPRSLVVVCWEELASWLVCVVCMVFSCVLLLSHLKRLVTDDITTCSKDCLGQKSVYICFLKDFPLISEVFINIDEYAKLYN